MLLALIRFLSGFLVIAGFQWLGNTLQSLWQLPIPGVVMGLLSLFSFLCLTKGRPLFLVTAGQSLIQWLPFFFIPVGAGIMLYANLVLEHTLLLIASIVLGTLASIVCIGWLQKHLLPPKREH